MIQYFKINTTAFAGVYFSPAENSLTNAETWSTVYDVFTFSLLCPCTLLALTTYVIYIPNSYCDLVNKLCFLFSKGVR